MILILLDSFKKDFQRLSIEIQKQTEKQLHFLVQNPRHPSLRVKKMEHPQNIWEARISKGYRLTFQIQAETLILRRVGNHDILKSP